MIKFWLRLTQWNFLRMRLINFSLELMIIIFTKEIYILLIQKSNKFGEVSKVIKPLWPNFRCTQANLKLIKKEFKWSSWYVWTYAVSINGLDGKIMVSKRWIIWSSSLFIWIKLRICLWCLMVSCSSICFCLSWWRWIYWCLGY